MKARGGCGDHGSWGGPQVVRCARRGWTFTEPGREERASAKRCWQRFVHQNYGCFVLDRRLDLRGGRRFLTSGSQEVNPRAQTPQWNVLGWSQGPSDDRTAPQQLDRTEISVKMQLRGCQNAHRFSQFQAAKNSPHALRKHHGTSCVDPKLVLTIRRRHSSCFARPSSCQPSGILKRDPGRISAGVRESTGSRSTAGQSTIVPALRLGQAAGMRAADKRACASVTWLVRPQVRGGFVAPKMMSGRDHGCLPARIHRETKYKPQRRPGEGARVWEAMLGFSRARGCTGSWQRQNMMSGRDHGSLPARIHRETKSQPRRRPGEGARVWEAMLEFSRSRGAQGWQRQNLASCRVSRRGSACGPLSALTKPSPRRWTPHSSASPPLRPRPPQKCEGWA